MKIFIITALPLVSLIFSTQMTSAESIPRNISVLITVAPRLALLLNQDDVEKELKSAKISTQSKDYTRQAENNTILYTVTE